MSFVRFAPRPFVAAARPSISLRSEFLGNQISSLSNCLADLVICPVSVSVRPQRAGALIVEANAKKSLGCTLEGSQRKRATTSGFRARMASKTGRKVLALRRKKGRKNLVPASVNGDPKK